MTVEPVVSSAMACTSSPETPASLMASFVALARATKLAIKEAGVSGDDVQAIALDTTGSTVIPVGKGLVPLDDYYLWCDHRAKDEAALITEAAHAAGLEAIQYC